MQSKANKQRTVRNRRQRVVKHLRNMIAKGVASRPHIVKTVNAYFPLTITHMDRHLLARNLWLAQAKLAGIIDEKHVPQTRKYVPPLSQEDVMVRAWGPDEQGEDWKAMANVADAYNLR